MSDPQSPQRMMTVTILCFNYASNSNQTTTDNCALKLGEYLGSFQQKTIIICYGLEEELWGKMALVCSTSKLFERVWISLAKQFVLTDWFAAWKKYAFQLHCTVSIRMMRHKALSIFDNIWVLRDEIWVIWHGSVYAVSNTSVTQLTK